MITLEISSTEIRLMEIEGGRVTKWSSRSLEPGILQEGVVSDPKALSATVRQLMSSSGLNGRNVTASVSGLYALSRIVRVPTPPGETVTRPAVLEAVTDVMPFSEEELYLSWQAVAPAEGGHQVLVVGVPRDVLDSEVQALRAGGVNPHILDIKGMALARAVNREQAIILNIESTSYDVVVVVNGITEVMRTTAWQAADLTLEDRAEALAIALELTVGFYISRHLSLPSGPATPLFVTGQMSGDLALVEKLQARIGYSIEPLLPPLEYPEHLPVSQYAVNIGLALKGIVSAKNPVPGSYALPNINLLPQVYRPWKPSPRQIYLFLAFVVAIALLFPLYRVTTDAMAKTAILEVKYTAINTELARRQVIIKEREPLQGAIAQYNAILAMGSGFIEDLKVVTSLAEKLGVELEPISHGGSEITFNARADSYIAFRDFLAALKENGRFASVTSPPERFSYVREGTITLKTKPGR